jgi:hypothetical protein
MQAAPAFYAANWQRCWPVAPTTAAARKRESRSDSRGWPSSPRSSARAAAQRIFKERDGCATFSAETSTHSMECAPREATEATIVTTGYPHVRKLGLTGAEDLPGPNAPAVVAATSNEQKLEPIR